MRKIGLAIVALGLLGGSARAELLARTHAHDEARHAYDVAIGLERDPAVRDFLLQRQSALAR